MKRELEVQATKTFENAVFDALPWWAVYTRHHHEKVVAEMLSAKGFEVFLPLYESTRRWKDRRMVLSLPLFPCYLFVRGGLDRKLQVVTTPGTAAMDHIDFVRPVHLGDLVTLRSSVNRAFNTSMEVGVKAWAENTRTGERVHVASAYLVFVAIDGEGARQRVPELRPENGRRDSPLRRCAPPTAESRDRSRTAQTSQDRVPRPTATLV